MNIIFSIDELMTPNTEEDEIVEKRLGIPPDYQYNALFHGGVFQRQWHRNRLLLIKEVFLSKNDKEKAFCDIGCGSGNVILVFNKQVKRFDAFDYNKECLAFLGKKLAENGIQNVRTTYWDTLTPAPLEAIGRYDKVILNEVIEHFHRHEISTILGNIKMLLQEDGELLITTPNCGFSPWFLLEFAVDRLGLFPKLWGEQHKVRITTKSFRVMCENEGFEVLSEGTFSFVSPFFIVFGRAVADFMAKLEIRYLKYFGSQLFIRVKKR